MGEAWQKEALGPAHEHLATRVVERVLSWLTEPARRAGGGGRLVLATLPGERHALGARLAGAAAGLEGWQVTDLGVDLPPEEIARAAAAVDAHAVALSMVAGEGLKEARTHLSRLRDALPRRVALLVGGNAVSSLENGGSLPAGIRVLEGLADLRTALGEALPG